MSSFELFLELWYSWPFKYNDDGHLCYRPFWKRDIDKMLSDEVKPMFPGGFEWKDD